MLGAASLATSRAEDAKTPNAPAILASQLQSHLNYLASPRMRGRGTGTPELERAAAYIAAEFKKYGLEPAFGADYYQKFSVTVGAELGKKNYVTPRFGPDARGLTLHRDFVPISFSDSGEASLPLVFAGYGITSEEHKFDEYLHLDVKDKAVIVLRHEPQENDEKSVFAGREFTTHSQVVSKAINARNHGAKAIILVNDPAAHPGEDDVLAKFGALAGPDNSGILVIQASQAVVNEWLTSAGKTLVGLQRAIDEKLASHSVPLPNFSLYLSVDVKRRTAWTSNVAAILRGSDAKLQEEAIVVGAHYDHLGLGERSSLAPAQVGQIHAGADDNASGAAAMLEIARALAAQRGQIKRSIVFLAFSAEEMGLLGSGHYTKSPAWPLEKTAAMVNLDMVGRAKDNKLFAGGVGTSPGFRALVEQANQGSFNLAYNESGYGASDHQSFYMKGVPVIFFFSGLHSDYHRPTDTPDRIAHADHARVAEVALRTTQSLAALETRPQYVKISEPPRPISGVGGSGYGPWFGSIPDMGEDVQGVKFGGVTEGSPAFVAGFKAGDILVDFGGKPIKNLYDFTYALRERKVGDEVMVTVLRGADRVSAKVKLTARR